MTDDELNEKMSDLDGNETNDVCYRGWERPTPTFGWWWRYIDFNKVELGRSTEDSTIGFMAKNKWGHDEYVCAPEESAKIREMCIAIVEDPDKDSDRTKRMALIDYFHTLEGFTPDEYLPWLKEVLRVKD